MTTPCKASTFLLCSFTYSSIGYFVILSVERYVSIVCPYQHKSWFTFKNQIITLAVAPVYGFSIGVAPLLGWSGYTRPRSNSIYCSFDFQLSNTKSYFIVAILFAFVVPVLVIGASFRYVIVELRCTYTRTRSKYGERSFITVESSKAVTGQSLSSLLTGLVFMGSWVPYSIVCFMYYTDQNVSREFEYSAKFLSKSSTISSTVVYCLIERRFRCFLNGIIRLKFDKARRTLSSHTTVTNTSTYGTEPTLL